MGFFVPRLPPILFTRYAMLPYGYKQAFILHFCVSLAYPFSNVTSLHFCKTSLCGGTKGCLSSASLPKTQIDLKGGREKGESLLQWTIFSSFPLNMSTLNSSLFTSFRLLFCGKVAYVLTSHVYVITRILTFFSF